MCVCVCVRVNVCTLYRYVYECIYTAKRKELLLMNLFIRSVLQL